MNCRQRGDRLCGSVKNVLNMFVCPCDCVLHKLMSGCVHVDSIWFVISVYSICVCINCITVGK